jgi:hypothetical protein
MVDPVTITAAVSAASSAFTAIQRGFAAARSIEDMTKDVSRWMSAVSDSSTPRSDLRSTPTSSENY